MKMEFFMPMLPPTVTFQEKKLAVRNGKPVIFDSDELKAAKEKLRAHLSTHIPEEPLSGALLLAVKWCYPADGKHPANTWKETKPDTDNLDKALKDCMETLGFFKNDAQVCVEHIEKFYNDVPGIYVQLENLP